MARSRATERIEFVARLARLLPDAPAHHVSDLARQLMRAGATLQRLAEAQCNGDYPADNGQRKTEVCQQCECAWAPEVLKGKPPTCPDCRTAARVSALLAPFGLSAIFNGDPRGAVLKIKTAPEQSDDWGREGICVP